MYTDCSELTLGASKNASFYVRTNSNVDVELGLNVTNWTPAGIKDYIGISWNYNGTLLTVNLDVSSSDDFVDFIVKNGVKSFGFDMTIYASGV